VRWGAVRFSVKAPGLLGGGRGWPPSRTCSGGALYGPGGPDLRPGPHRPADLDPAAAAPSSPRPPMPIIDQPPESRFASLLKTFFDSIDPTQTKVGSMAVDRYRRRAAGHLERTQGRATPQLQMNSIAS